MLSILTAVTLATGLATNSVTLEVCERFGDLAAERRILVAEGGQLAGPYGNALTGLSVASIGLVGVSAVMVGVHLSRVSSLKFFVRSAGISRRLLWVSMLLSGLLILGAVSLSLYLTEHYEHIDSLVPDPNPIVPGQNYSLRGPMGIATVTMTGLSLSFIACTLALGLWQMRSFQKWVERLLHQNKQES